MVLWVNNSKTSYLFVFTLFITGIKKTNEKNKETAAAINKYRNTCILYYLFSSDCYIIASLDNYRDLRILFKQFYL